MSFRQNGKLIRFVLKRKFDNCDPNDYIIEVIKLFLTSDPNL